MLAEHLSSDGEGLKKDDLSPQFFCRDLWPSTHSAKRESKLFSSCVPFFHSALFSPTLKQQLAATRLDGFGKNQTAPGYRPHIITYLSLSQQLMEE
jgi:hypothetical protein